MVKKERVERGLTAESVLNNLQYIEGYKNKIQYLNQMYYSGKFKKGEEESARKSILLAQGKLALREGHKPNSTYINETIKKSGRGLDQLQNEFMKRIRKGEEDHKRNIFDQIINSPTYHNPAINLAIERGDANLAVKLYNEQNKSSAKEGKSDYYKGLADIYSLLGQHGSAKEHYLKYKNALIAEEEKAHNHGYTSAEYSLRRELKGLDEKIENENKAMKKKTLERRASSMVAIAGFGAGIFFLQSNITGNAIADLTAKNTSFIGAGLLVVGLIAGFFWIKSRKK